MTIANDESGAPDYRTGVLNWIEAEPRPHGALRYQCPVDDSFVVVTDDATLAALARPRAQVRCPFCGQQHVLRRGRSKDTAIVVARAAS
jgi:hypothetical protein